MKYGELRPGDLMVSLYGGSLRLILDVCIGVYTITFRYMNCSEKFYSLNRIDTIVVNLGDECGNVFVCRDGKKLF